MSKGRAVFTRLEIWRIKRLLKAKQTASLSRQKTIRSRIRRIGFYISDFRVTSRAFTVDDFDALIESGAVKVKGASTRRPGTESTWRRLCRWFRRVLGRP